MAGNWHSTSSKFHDATQKGLDALVLLRRLQASRKLSATAFLEIRTTNGRCKR
jgi:hypothetical protein